LQWPYIGSNATAVVPVGADGTTKVGVEEPEESMMERVSERMISESESAGATPLSPMKAPTVPTLPMVTALAPCTPKAMMFGY
jgi:hypothetical protein